MRNGLPPHPVSDTAQTAQAAQAAQAAQTVHAAGAADAAPAGRASVTATLQAIAARPWAYDFFQALRMIDARQPRRPRLGTARRPADEPLRLGQTPDLSFAPAALQRVVFDTRGGRPRLDVRFFGLFGPNGPMPLHLSEYARERQLHHGDETLARFADLFHHRLLLLFYRAWAQGQPTVSLDRPADDRFADWVGSLLGIGTPALRQRAGVDDHALRHAAGLLSRQVRSAEGLEALLAGWLRRPVRVEQFAGTWMGLDASERTRLGRRRGGRLNTSARLGQGAVLGAMVWDRQHHVRLWIGPLDHAAFTSLLPGGSRLQGLVALVEQYLGHEFGWDLQLQLQRDQARPVQLGQHGRLGWDSWLPQPAAPAPAAPRPRGAHDVVGLRLTPARALRAAARQRPASASSALHPHP